MEYNTEQPKRRTYRRASRYTQQLSVGFDVELWAELVAVANKHQLAVSEVVRQAASAGLPKLRDRLRKRASR